MEVILSGKASYGTERQFKTSSGQVRWALADRIPYRDDEGNDIARGQISLLDTTENVTLYGDWVVMKGVGNEVKTYNVEDQPLLVKEMSDDSLFLKSDTLFFIEKNGVKQNGQE